MCIRMTSAMIWNVWCQCDCLYLPSLWLIYTLYLCRHLPSPLPSSSSSSLSPSSPPILKGMCNITFNIIYILACHSVTTNWVHSCEYVSLRVWLCNTNCLSQQVCVCFSASAAVIYIAQRVSLLRSFWCLEGTLKCSFLSPLNYVSANLSFSFLSTGRCCSLSSRVSSLVMSNWHLTC